MYCFGLSLVVWVASYVVWPISFVVVKDISLFLLRNWSLVTLQVVGASPITPWYDRKIGRVLFWPFVGCLGCFVCRVANLGCLG